eukprot:878072-Pelagomonas_calceolata.AAC.2
MSTDKGKPRAEFWISDQPGGGRTRQEREWMRGPSGGARPCVGHPPHVAYSPPRPLHHPHCFLPPGHPPESGGSAHCSPGACCAPKCCGGGVAGLGWRCFGYPEGACTPHT